MIAEVCCLLLSDSQHSCFHFVRRFFKPSFNLVLSESQSRCKFAASYLANVPFLREFLLQLLYLLG